MPFFFFLTEEVGGEIARDMREGILTFEAAAIFKISLKRISMMK